MPNTQTLPVDDWSGAEEVASNWFKFENVGDKIKGTLVNKRFQKSANPAMPDQWVYELKKAGGAVFNVGVSVGKPGTVQRLNNCKVGEVIGIVFEKTIPATMKGFADAKALKVVTFGMDPEYKEFETDEATGPALPPFN
mgnify:CR=1 FL=1